MACYEAIFGREGRLKILILLSCLLVLIQGCDRHCDASTCSGCCFEDVCYLQCDKNNGTGGGNAINCIKEYHSCSLQAACCSQNDEGDPLSCNSGTCTKNCKTSGSCSSDSECCKSPLSSTSYSQYCDFSSNSCSLCSRKGTECYGFRSGECCAGLSCGSKPSTPNFKECL